MSDLKFKKYPLKEFGQDHQGRESFSFEEFKVENQQDILSFKEDKNFLISPIIKKHQGILDKERRDREEKIHNLVKERFEAIKEDAFAQGLKNGFDQGRQEAFSDLEAKSDEKIKALTSMIDETICFKKGLMRDQKKEIYGLVRDLVKWIICRELKNDGDYIYRLLDRMIQEIDDKDHLLVQVNESKFQEIPEILSRLKKRLGEMANIRVEVDYGIKGHGIIIESENGIINGTLEEQLNSLDKIFESVGPDPHGKT